MGVSSILDELKNEYSDLNPILVLAPIQRCGTTLLQRAINSGDKAVIYGENFVMMEKMPYLIGGSFKSFEAKKQNADAAEKEFFAEKNIAMDSTTLFPGYSEYSKETLRSLYDIFNHYNKYSKDRGYQHWGIKHQVVDYRGMFNFLRFMPSCRIIVMYRDLLDVARSYRARWPDRARSEDHLREIAKRWTEHLNFLLNLEYPKLVIQYEALVKHPNKNMERIEKHLGIKLDRSVINTKMNIHPSDYESSDQGATTLQQYKEPASLSAKEEALLLSVAGATYKKVGYG